MKTLFGFRKQQAAEMPAIVDGGIVCYNRDMLYMSKSEKFLTMTVTSKRGSVKYSISLDEEATKKLQWMLGVRNYEPVE